MIIITDNNFNDNNANNKYNNNNNNYNINNNNNNNSIDDNNITVNRGKTLQINENRKCNHSNI